MPHPALSDCAVGPVEFPEERPWLQTVDGTGLDYYGRGHLPFLTEDNDGNLVQGQLQAEFTNVDRVVLSCGQMATLGTGSWFPPEDGQSYWLVNSNDEWLELPGPGLVREGQLVPLEKKNGVYVMKMRFGQHSDEPTVMAPLEAMQDEDSIEDLMHQARQQQAYDNILQPFDPEDFEDATCSTRD